MTALILASGSPRRLALLRAAGLQVTVASAECDEDRYTGEPVLDYAMRLARTKLQAARRAHPDLDPTLPWLAADTVVWFPSTAAGAATDEALGKPTDSNQARAFVRALTDGPPHAVTTAWALARDASAEPEVHAETTRVVMRRLSDSELEDYLRSEQWADKAGGYGIQDGAASFVTRIEGSYTNVVGLPLAQVMTALHGSSLPKGSR